MTRDTPIRSLLARAKMAHDCGLEQGGAGGDGLSLSS